MNALSSQAAKWHEKRVKKIKGAPSKAQAKVLRERERERI